MNRATGLQRLQTGTYSSKGERLDWSYYDTAIMKNALGVTTYRLFTQGIGQADPTGVTKTLDLTNMKTSGIMPQNQHFKIKAIRLSYHTHATLLTALEIFNVMQKTVLEISINGKDASYQKVLADIMGIPLSSEITLAATYAQSTGRYLGVDVLNKPITLAANVPFEVDVKLIAASAAALDADRLRVSLQGILIRAM